MGRRDEVADALLPGDAPDERRDRPVRIDPEVDQGFDVRGSALLAASCALLTAVGLLTIRRRTIRTA